MSSQQICNISHKKDLTELNIFQKVLGGYFLKHQNAVATQRWKKFENMFSRFDRIPACDRRTARRTDGRIEILRQHRARYA